MADDLSEIGRFAQIHGSGEPSAPARHPKVSVCCAWYNRAEYIKATVDSILQQDFDNYELIIVNDGSEDLRVKNILDSYAHTKIRVIHQNNTGFTEALCRAIKESTGEYIAIQGAGDISLPGRLRKQVSLLESDPDVGVVSTSYQNVYVGGVRDGIQTEVIPANLAPSLAHLRRFGNPINHGSSIIRRSAYEKVGGYNKYFKYGQDYDLWLRIVENYKIAIIDEILYNRFIFESDGVASDPSKQILQQLLVSHSKSLSIFRNTKHFSLMASIDHYSALFRLRDRDVARNLSKLSLKYAAMGRASDANFLAHVALNEATTPLTLIARIIVEMSTRIAVVQHILKSLYIARRQNK